MDSDRESIRGYFVFSLNDEVENMNEETVITKFLIWYECLTPPERLIFEGCLGRIVKMVAKEI